MSYEDHLSPGERELADCLGQLAPAAHRIERDVVMFRAGQRSMLRRVRQWQATGATILALAAGFNLLSRHSGMPTPPPVLASRSASSLPIGSASVLAPAEIPLYSGSLLQGRGYFWLRNLLTTEGVYELPVSYPASTSSGPIQSIRDWRQLLGVASQNPVSHRFNAEFKNGDQS
jgi:hypothetical protein